MSDRRHGRRCRRSTTSRMGQPARSSLRVGADSRPPARRPHRARYRRDQEAGRARPPGPFHRHVAGVPGRRPLLLERLVVLVEDDDRPDARHRRPRPGSGSHDHVDPARGRAQSCGTIATHSPARRRRAPSNRAWSTEGSTTRVGPTAAAARTTGTGSALGGRRTPLPRRRAGGPRRHRPARAGRVTAGAGSAGTARGGEAASRKGRSRPAAHRRDAHAASSITSADGPWPVTLARGRSLASGTPGSGGPTATTHPPTRRPARPTPTIVPAPSPRATRRAPGSRTACRGP